MKNAHAVTRDFEAALVEYTGAPYAVAVNSCTMALLLACQWHRLYRTEFPLNQPYGIARPYVSIPKRTYVSVPQSIIHAGYWPVYRNREWIGCYQLEPLPVWDCARMFTSEMYKTGQMQCVSFHTSKILGDTQGGAILHDNSVADIWFRHARFDGRTEGVPPAQDTFTLGWHCYMSPDVATRLLAKLGTLSRDNDPLPNDDYPDLSLTDWGALR